MKRGVLIAVLWLAGGIAIPAVAVEESVRVEVATLDGAPVYHWRTFKSTVANDVDRALILREFQRRGFKLSSKLVDDAVKGAVAQNTGGDTRKFADELRQNDASMEDFRCFVSEEIMMAAMLHQDGSPAERQRKQEQWIAKLRVGAVVKKLKAAP